MRSSVLEEKQGNRPRICLGHQKEEVRCTELDCLGGGWEEPGLTSEMSTGWRVRWELCPEKAQESCLLGAPGRRCCTCWGLTRGCASSTTVLQSMKLGVDVNRHKEVIVKAISAVLLLLLKHFKLNHVYQVSTAPSFCPRGQDLGQCCSSGPKEQRLGLQTSLSSAQMCR